jgi:tRNA U55 pseudouridine synthase TruB
MEGVVLFNKPKYYTSYQIVEFFKKRTKKKVGHGGTLDPLAEGLLILGIGEYTKELNKFLKESTKTYIAEIILGSRSTTYDREGTIIYPNDNRIFGSNSGNEFGQYSGDNNHPHKAALDPSLSANKIKEVINSFIGEIEQIPPPFSAVKIKGKPAYLLARKGKKVDLKPRKVKIYEIKILDYNWPTLKIEVTSSSGTYIRSLANDIGEKLGCGGYLNDLKRTKIIYPNKQPNKQTNKLPESSDRIFGQNSGKVFGEYSGNVFTIEQALTFEDMENNFLEFYAKVYGRVQGVGYRYFVKEKAQNLDLFGYVKNLEDGSVEVLAQGREENLQKLIEELKKGSFLARVDKLDIVFRKPLNIFYNFRIEH